MPENPHPIVAWANKQTADALLAWMRERLHGRDLLWPIDRMSEEAPHHLIETLYRHQEVSPEIKFYLLDGTMRLLRDCIQPPHAESLWTPAATAELCLLVPGVIDGTPFMADARRHLKDVLESGFITAKGGADLENHVLRTLLELGLRETPEFWLSRDLPDDPVRNVIVAQALMILDEWAFFGWLQSRSEEKLRHVAETLARPWRRRSEADLAFARKLRIILKNSGLHVLEYNLTQIGSKRTGNVKGVEMLQEALALARGNAFCSIESYIEIQPKVAGEYEVSYCQRLEPFLGAILSTIENPSIGKYVGENKRQLVENLARGLGYSKPVVR